MDGPTVLTVFVNGSPTPMSAAVPAASTANVDGAGTVNVSDGDRVFVMIDITGATSGFINVTVSYEVL